jgi:hypothetical protein
LAKGIDRKELHQLARLGAAARLEALESERTAILRAFPDLRRGEPGRETRAGQARPQRRRRRMSAAERKAVSERMRRYWADRRKESSQREQGKPAGRGRKAGRRGGRKKKAAS